MKWLWMIFLGINYTSLYSDSTTLKPLTNRRIAVWSANIGVPVGVHAVLYKTWYGQYPTIPFHWKNDNRSWNQMDKVGHLYSAYYIAANSANSFRYAGYSKEKSALFGAAVSVGFQFTIEYFDGMSQGWGASYGDLIANSMGTLGGGIQSYLWGEVKIPMNLTFQKSNFSHYRPEILGRGFFETKLKDYNSQTYWLHLIPAKLTNKPIKFPKWLGISVGYGVNGLLGGEDNVWINQQSQVMADLSAIPRQRQYYISPAISLSKIPTRHSFIKFLFKLTDYWKLPLPALEINQPGKLKFYGLYW